MTIKIVEYWLNRQEHETLCVVIDHLETQEELDSIKFSEVLELERVLKAMGVPCSFLGKPAKKVYFDKYVAPYFMIGRDVEDGCMVAISSVDFKAAEVVSL